MNIKFLFTGLVLSAIFSSCMDVDFTLPTDNDAIEAFGQATKSVESDDVIEITDALINDFISTATSASVKAKVKSNIAQPEVELLSTKGQYPENYVVDFGEGSYVDQFNRTISGKVFFSKSDKIGTVRTYNFSKFRLDSTSVKSNRIIERTNATELKIAATDTITYKNGQTYMRSWERTRTLIDSSGDVSEYWNNSYSITGKSKGNSVKNKGFEMDIQKPLISVAGYKYYVSGVVKIKTDKGVQFIDFGDGTKDNIVEIKTNGKKSTVTLNWD